MIACALHVRPLRCFFGRLRPSWCRSCSCFSPDDFRQRAREVFEEVASSNPGRFLAMRARLRADSLNEPNG
ncbi:MAG: hypothetical protein OXG81_13390 [Acidobacteria bacterium]|nr:hypothetical protein [Acidobacteriota bacterium]